jgi:uncharacterized repeat protein (TIGR01451 family)
MAVSIVSLIVIFNAQPAFSQEPPLLIPQPGQGNLVLPIFQKPFVGDYPLINFFDHNLPFEFNTTPGIANNFQLTWWGERTFGIDGHNGYDWPMPEGTPILAVADGTVVVAGQQAPFFCPLLNAVTTPTLIAIDHEQLTPGQPAIRSRYNHLSRIDVAAGQEVKAGDQIGLSGNVGCSSAPHLHLETHRFVPATGRFSAIDPFGWEGEDADPWAEHPQGTDSLWLWKDGQAPAIFREIRRAPNANGGTFSASITAFRYMGWKDDDNPNNEFVEISLDNRFAPSGSVDLTGFRLVNNKGDVFNFPNGFVLRDGSPVKVYSGSGINTNAELYWGQSRGMWNNMGDCVRRLNSAGALQFVFSAGTCGVVPSADLTVTATADSTAGTVSEALTYTISLSSNGPDNATGVVVTNDLPDGVTLASVAASQGGCFGTYTIVCNIGTIANGASATVTISVIPTQPGTITNNFKVEANETDPELSNNIATVSTTTNGAQPPDTSIKSGPPALSNSTSATFTFAANEAGSTFACSLDSGAFASCASPKTYTGLSDGAHDFQVRATNQAGTSDSTPASYNWTIDIIPPDTNITSNPPATTNSTAASFSFTSTEDSGTFACSLDGSAFIDCTTPHSYNGLTAARHTFQVRAIDAAGNFDTTPASYTWTVTTAVDAALCSTLGDDPKPSLLDQDIYTLQATKGEQLRVRLESIGTNNKGNRASLALVDNISGVNLLKSDNSALPNEVSATLPAAGEYLVIIAEQPAILSSSRFRGNYCISVQSSGGAAQTLQRTGWVED